MNTNLGGGTLTSLINWCGGINDGRGGGGAQCPMYSNGLREVFSSGGGFNGGKSLLEDLWVAEINFLSMEEEAYLFGRGGGLSCHQRR